MALLQMRPALLGLMVVFALAACGSSQTPPPAPAATPPTARATDTPPASAAHDTQPAADAPASELADRAEATSADQAPQASDATATEAPAQPDANAASESTAVESAATNATAASGPEPRLNVDYRLIDPPQQLQGEPGKVEIAEVFAYTCIHCARLEPMLAPWLASLPPQVNFVKVPMAHGAFEPLARAFYAAQNMGLTEQTSKGMFKALAEDHKLGNGKLDTIAGLYADLGVDAEALKKIAVSFTVNTQIARNQKTVTRWGIEGTPSLVVAGKYLVTATADRGHEGMLQSARWLAQREIDAQKQ